MNLPYNLFLKKLEAINACFRNKPSCPIKNDQFCLKNQLDCNKGKKNICVQYLDIEINKRFYSLTVRFYGENRIGFVRTEEANIKNLVTKEKELFQDLIK